MDTHSFYPEKETECNHLIYELRMRVVCVCVCVVEAQHTFIWTYMHQSAALCNLIEAIMWSFGLGFFTPSFSVFVPRSWGIICALWRIYGNICVAVLCKCVRMCCCWFFCAAAFASLLNGGRRSCTLMRRCGCCQIVLIFRDENLPNLFHSKRWERRTELSWAQLATCDS